MCHPELVSGSRSIKKEGVPKQVRDDTTQTRQRSFGALTPQDDKAKNCIKQKIPIG